MHSSVYAAVTGGNIQTGIATALTGTAAFNNLPANIMPVPDACTSGNNTTYTPGNDPCGTDLIIRSNDVVTYQMTYITNGADTVTIVSNLPVVGGAPAADWVVGASPQCTNGGGVISNGGQTLTCVLSIASAGTQSILPQARTRALNNGVQIPLPVTNMSDLGGGTIVANASVLSTVKPLTVSAAPLFDITSGSDGPAGRPAVYKLGPDGVTPGWMFPYAVTVRAPYGSRGLENLNAAGISLTSAISALTVAGGTPAENAAVQAAMRASAVLDQNKCLASQRTYDVYEPYSNLTGNAVFNSYTVDSGGFCTGTQSAPGASVPLTLTGAKWTTSNYPDPSGNGLGTGVSAPYDNIMVSFVVAYWVPATVFNGVANGTTMYVTSALTNIVGTSVTNQPLKQPGTPTNPTGTENDAMTDTKVVLAQGGGFQKLFSVNWSRNYPFQVGATYPAYINIFNNGDSVLLNSVACDKFDNTKMKFAAIPSVPDPNILWEFGTGGIGGVGDSWANNADFAAATCADGESSGGPNGGWYTSAASVPGGLEKITKVRMKVASINPTQGTGFQQINFIVTSPSLVAGFGKPAGTVWPAETVINNWGTESFGFYTAANGVLGNVNGLPMYWANTKTGATAYDAAGVAQGGSTSDSALMAFANARITKEVAGQASASNPSQVVAGSTVNYVLKPTLTATLSAGSFPVKVTDILPPFTSYVAGSASIPPTTVQSNYPSAGYTTITWDIPSVTPNIAIPPITFNALVSGTAADGTSIPNFTRITSPGDPLVDCSLPTAGTYGTYTNTGVSTSGTLCPNAARRDLAISSPPGFRVFKDTSKASTEPNSQFKNNLSWVSIGNDVTKIDIIDVLPYVGDGPAVVATENPGRTPATSITAPGTLTLVAVPLSVANDPTAKFYYTTAAPASINRNPQAPVNGSLGAPSALWTLCVANVCPATSTAVRYVSGTAALAGVTYSYSTTLLPANVTPNDVFSNTFSAAGSGLATPVGSNPAVTTARLGSISGNVFLDANNDGLNTGDTGIQNVEMCIQGYRNGPNEIDNGGAGDDIAVPKTCVLTDAAGNYKFSNLYAGKYSVTQTRLPVNAAATGLVGKFDGKDTAGTLDGTVANNLGTADDAITGIVMPVGADATGYNFGEILPASLSGKVFNDVDSNGVDTGNAEPGFAKALITLTGLDDLGNAITLYACTDAAGKYSFIAGGAVQVGGTAPNCATTTIAANPAFLGLRPGSYSVEETTATQPGFIDTTPSSNLGTGATSAGLSKTNLITGVVLQSGNAAINYNFGETIKKYNVTGSVFNDTNGNTDGIIASATATNAASTQLYAVVVGSDGKVVSSALVQPDGTYVVPNVPPGTGYTVRLVDTATAPVFASVAPAPSLPTGWQNTGEASAAATGLAPDATVDGITAPFNLVAADVPNRNFGIQQPPVAGNAVVAQANNPGATNTASVPAGAFTGTLPSGVTGTNATDPTPGAVTSVQIPTFPTNTTSITINGVTYYNGAPPAGAPAGSLAFPAGGVTVTTAQLAGMTLDPTDGPVGAVQNSVIDYFPIDAAGAKSTVKGTVTLPFLNTGYKVSGTVFNDTNGLVGDNFVNGTGTEAPATGVATSLLSAYLVGPDGLVKATSDVAADGTYLFTGVPPATGYTVVLANKAPVAADIGVAPPAASLPAGWKNTGEVNGSTTTANTETGAAIADGKTAAFDVSAADVVDRNFGIQQPPVAGSFQYTSVPNPGGTDTLPVDAGAFTGTLPTAGTGTNATDPTAVTAIKITGIPANVTSITINGVKYGAGFAAFPAGGVTLTPGQLAGMVVDPADGASNIDIPYVAIDAAGQASPAGKVTLVVGTPGKVDVVKSAGVPVQLSPTSFKVPYKVVVGNVAAGAPTVYNVQVNDNLKVTYPTATSIVVSGYALASAGGATCNVPATAFAGTSAASALLSGTDDLAAGHSCIVSFFATVDFPAGAVPTAAQNNTAYGSGMGSNTQNNAGTAITDAGVITLPSGSTTTDPSTNVPAPAGSVAGALPATPALPTTAGTDAAAPSPVTFTLNKIDTVKSVGVPLQTGPTTFDIAYSVVVGNSGTPTVYNVQANDFLSNTYTTPATFTVSGYTVTAAGGATCTAAASFTGVGATSALLAGTNQLATGQSCVITYKVTVNYNSATIPTRYNNVLASGMGSASATANPGFASATQDPATGLITSAAAPTGATTTDYSVNVAPPAGGAPGATPATPALPGTAGSDASAGVPTPVTPVPNKVDAVKSAGVPLQTGPTTFETSFSVVVGNKGVPTVYNVQANDFLSNTYPAPATFTVSGYTVTAAGGATCTPATSFTGVGATSALLAGTNQLATGQSCVITYKATVNYNATPIPAGFNNVLASGMGSASATPNPGFTAVTQDPVTGLITGAAAPAGATTTDYSANIAPPAGGVPGAVPATPALPATPGADPATGVPTPASPVANKIDVVKAAGVPLQVAPKIFEIQYSVLVANVGATSPTVFNVQANDNLKLTYPTAASIVVSNYAVAASAGTPAATCAVSVPAFAGTAAASAMLSGTGDLAGGQSCIVTFKARVDFGAAAVPATTQNNTVYASGVGSDAVENKVGYVVPDTGAPTPPPLATTTDISVAAAPTTGLPGTAPATPLPPTTPGGDAPGGTPTPVTLTSQKIDTVKAAGVPKQIGPKVFEVSYSILVANVCKEAPLTCATTPTVFNVQANDNLANTFPTATSVVVSNYVVTNGANGATCTAASPAFAGTATTSALLSGTNDLAGGQTCIITFKATVDYGANPLPTAAQNNSAYASGTGTDSIVNPGYTYAADGKAIPPVNASTTDISAAAPPTTGAPGTLPATPLPPTVPGGDSELGVPTPVIFTQQEDGELQVKKSTITKEASAGDVVEYSIVVNNTSSSAVKTKVTDTPPVGFEYVAGSAKIGSTPVSSTTSGSNLIFDVGTIPANSAIVLTYKMKLGDAVEAGDAKNCVTATGVNTLTNGDKESGQSCASVVIKTGLFLEKRVNLTKAELGDSVEYSLRVKSVGGTTKNVTISDNLPLGFKLIAGTVKVIRAGATNSMADPAGSPGPALTFNVGTVVNKEVVEIRYRVRLGIGSDIGDGINKAQAKAPFATSSLIAKAKVTVTRGVFTREACIAGKVFMDCNQNKVQDQGEFSIPGVRLYMEDGTNITTDENGQYSICGVRATSHVMAVDMTTMPIGSRMGLTSNENLGSGKSLMLNIKAGELHRADFIESSCFPKVQEQIQQRLKNADGVVSTPLTQTGLDKPGIVFDAKEQELLAPALRGVK